MRTEGTSSMTLLRLVHFNTSALDIVEVARKWSGCGEGCVDRTDGGGVRTGVGGPGLVSLCIQTCDRGLQPHIAEQDSSVHLLQRNTDGSLAARCVVLFITLQSDSGALLAQLYSHRRPKTTSAPRQNRLLFPTGIMF